MLLDERARRRSGADVDVALPAHLSTSALVALAEDAERFTLDLRRPMPTAPAPATRRGTAFHAWVEEHYSRAAFVDLDELPGSADDDAGRHRPGRPAGGLPGQRVGRPHAGRGRDQRRDRGRRHRGARPDRRGVRGGRGRRRAGLGRRRLEDRSTRAAEPGRRPARCSSRPTASRGRGCAACPSTGCGAPSSTRPRARRSGPSCPGADEITRSSGGSSSLRSISVVTWSASSTGSSPRLLGASSSAGSGVVRGPDASSRATRPRVTSSAASVASSAASVVGGRVVVGIRPVGAPSASAVRRPPSRPRRPAAVAPLRAGSASTSSATSGRSSSSSSTTRAGGLRGAAARPDRRERGAPVVVGLLAGRVHGVVEPAQLGGEHLDGADVLAGQRHHQGAEQAELGDQPGPHEQVGVGALDPGVRVGLEHGLDRLGRGVGDQGREVVGGVGDLGVLPAGDRPHLARSRRRRRR